MYVPFAVSIWFSTNFTIHIFPSLLLWGVFSQRERALSRMSVRATIVSVKKTFQIAIDGPVAAGKGTTLTLKIPYKQGSRAAKGGEKNV
jgi:hypothetical protein